ncbi:helix-turn-helix transcriptional regulator [Lihuaxuella thermophila]|uniref:DNA-binding transcriptional regulator, XRE-family HTH domain n=1 Tax=Lihuaxuella thermophila TaxID=1173111 RepID=A0A1H8HA10_9BACL|nr:helix-turn-helix transcriptional regulator [Lihuaxuella thermophila]SEN53056.1 DNA-binding transcriptional regulator, XRE-family HTH domain [Lihuaxuella thermophila]
MNKKLIAAKLISLRGDKSRDEVAKAIGISVSALQMYENGRRIPRDPVKIKLAKYYGVSVQEIFFGDQPHEMCG